MGKHQTLFTVHFLKHFKKKQTKNPTKQLPYLHLIRFHEYLHVEEPILTEHRGTYTEAEDATVAVMFQ